MSETQAAKKEDNCQHEINLMSQLTQQRDGNGTHGEAQTISLQNKGRSKRNGDGQLENNRIVLKQAHPNDQNHSDEEVKQGTCLYISNLSHKVTDQQLMNIFSAYGKVDYANICYEPYSQQQKGQRIPRGIGFVKYVDGRDAQRAIDKLNGKMIKKKEIKIMISRREEPRLTQKGPYFGKSSKRGINKKEIEVDNYTKDYSKRRNGQSPNNRELDSDYASRRSSSSSSESNGDLTYQQKIINQGKNNQRKQDFEKEEAFSDQNGVAAEKDQNSEMTANNTNGFYEQHINRDPNLEGDSQKNQSVRLDQENNTQNNNRSTKGNGNHENSQRSFYQTPERSVRHRRDSTKSRSRSDKKNSSSSQNKSSNNSHSSRSQHSNYRSSNHHRGSRYSSSSSSPSQRSSSSSSSSQASSNKQRKRSSSSTSSSSPSRSSSSSSSSREAENRQKDNHIKRSQNNYQHKKNIVTHKSSSSRQSNRNRRSSTADRMQQQKQSQPQN